MPAYRRLLAGLLGGLALWAAGTSADARAQGKEWTGFYVGANAGYQWGTGSNGLILLPDVAAWTAGSPAFAQFNGRYGETPDGPLGGAQLGFNWRSGTIVMGVEADFDWLDADETTVRTAFIPPPVSFTNSGIVRQELDWLATLRARLGLLVSADQRLLVYLTGGLAFGHIKTSHFSINTDVTPNAGFAGSSSDTEVGGTVGGGLEWKLDSLWSLKAEYLYYDLGEQRVKGSNFNSISPPGFGVDAFYDTQGHIVRVGINYKLVDF